VLGVPGEAGRGRKNRTRGSRGLQPIPTSRRCFRSPAGAGDCACERAAGAGGHRGGGAGGDRGSLLGLPASFSKTADGAELPRDVGEVEAASVPSMLVKGPAFWRKVHRLIAEGVTAAGTRHDAVLTLSFAWGRRRASPMGDAGSAGGVVRGACARGLAVGGVAAVHARVRAGGGALPGEARPAVAVPWPWSRVGGVDGRAGRGGSARARAGRPARPDRGVGGAGVPGGQGRRRRHRRGSGRVGNGPGAAAVGRSAGRGRGRAAAGGGAGGRGAGAARGDHPPQRARRRAAGAAVVGLVPLRVGGGAGGW
jgi:hypothetical protein